MVHWIDVDGVSHEQVFPLRDVVALTSDPASVGFGGTSATTPEAVKKFVARLAEWTGQFASTLLADGDELFDELRARNSAWFEAEQHGRRARLLRSQADKAWRERDFATVVNAYTEIDQELSSIELRPSERGRLDYAQRESTT